MLKIKQLLVIFLFSAYFAFLTSVTHAEEFTYEFNGKIIEQPTYRFLKDDYLLNPKQEILDLSYWSNRFYGDINLALNYKNIKLITKFRPTVTSNRDTTNLRNIIDDAYLDIGLSERFFFYIGEKNVRDGVGLGSNPTDFLGEEKEVDMTKREEERRVERKGNYLVGFDAYYEAITFTAIFAPRIQDKQEEKDRLLLKTNLLLESINTDMSFHYFNGNIPGIGFNISSAIGESLVLHTESTLRWGSTKKKVKLITEGIPNSYEITDPYDSHKVYPHLVIGGHYTFTDKTNIICEYIYKGDGYNGREWDEFERFIRYNYDEFKRGFLPELTSSNLLQANNMMTFRDMRRNYLFIRISNPEIYKKIDGALVFLLNADDKSFLINPSIDYQLKTNTTIGLTGIVFAGDNDTEFGMTPWKSEISLIYKYFF